MMKRSYLGLSLLFAVTAVVTAVASLPLAMVLKLANAPLTAERVDGTVWNGQIVNAWVAGYPAGTISVSGRLLPLFTGQIAAEIDVRGGVARGQAVVGARPGRLSFQDLRVVADLSTLNLRDAFGTPMRGRAEVTAPRLVLTEEGCETGTLSASTDILEQSAGRYGGEGFVLSGNGACEDGALTLPLSGAGSEGAARATIRVSADGYQTEFVVEPRDAELAQVLEIYGFQRIGETYSLIQRGEVF